VFFIMSYPTTSAEPGYGPALRAHPGRVLVAAAVEGMSVELAEGAQCGYDPELHTGPDAFTEEPDAERAAREQVAMEVCATCTVRRECLTRALAIRPNAGVWAGFTATEVTALAELIDAFELGHLVEVA
jgi:WhiB family redox-sensing transcriptional regulator